MDLNVALMFIFLIALNQFNGSINAQKDKLNFENENNKNELNSKYIDNEIDMKPTFRSGFEKFLQGLSITWKVFKLNRIDGKLINIALEPLRRIFLPNKNETQLNNIGRNQSGFEEFSNIINENFTAIFPGTLWCGGGNIARNPDDIGEFSKTDKCCKDHDQCPSTIAVGESKGLLKNNGIFVRSDCSCDHHFYDCLKKVNTLISRGIGIMYFNILRPQCYNYSYPIEACEKYDSTRQTENKCLQYKFDETKNKSFEWFDCPDF